MEGNKYCHQCDNHCSINNLRCYRGRAFFGIQEDDMQKGHHDRDFSGTLGLLKKCGHTLHHNPSIDNETICKNLTSEEQRMLEKLLNKILENLD